MGLTDESHSIRVLMILRMGTPMPQLASLFPVHEAKSLIVRARDYAMGTGAAAEAEASGTNGTNAPELNEF
jgi:hypothetical protein